MYKLQFMYYELKERQVDFDCYYLIWTNSFLFHRHSISSQRSWPLWTTIFTFLGVAAILGVTIGLLVHFLAVGQYRLFSIFILAINLLVLKIEKKPWTLNFFLGVFLFTYYFISTQFIIIQKFIKFFESEASL